MERKNRSVIFDTPLSDDARNRVLRIVGGMESRRRDDVEVLSQDRLVSFLQKMI